MLTICTRWELSQMPAELEWRMWRQLRGAFKIDRFVFTPVVEELSRVAIEQYPTMEEALAACEGELTFLEPKGGKSVADIPKGDVTLVLGNTQRHNLQHVDPADAYRIRTPEAVDFYGINAAAIAMAIRYGQ